MSKVLVIDQRKRPLDPVHPAQARQLLRSKKAAIYRQFPFTLILKESRTGTPVLPLRLKIDPGAKVTGIGLVNDSSALVVFVAELKHRGFAIRDALTSRRQLRRGRRARKTRYRQPRFLNRTRPEGWLAPSLQSRVDNIETWVKKLRQFAPIEAISQELVRFDMQLMGNPDIQGNEYMQGTLQGFETREFLLEKWNRQCAYCDVKDVPGASTFGGSTFLDELYSRVFGVPKLCLFQKWMLPMFLSRLNTFFQKLEAGQTQSQT